MEFKTRLQLLLIESQSPIPNLSKHYAAYQYWKEALDEKDWFTSKYSLKLPRKALR